MNCWFGCKKPKNVNKFFDRTADVAAMVRPCGIVVNFTEMFTCESPTQRYLFLVFNFGRGSDFDSILTSKAFWLQGNVRLQHCAEQALSGSIVTRRLSEWRGIVSISSCTLWLASTTNIVKGNYILKVLCNVYHLLAFCNMHSIMFCL